MEIIIGIGVWGLIFLVWYMRTYPEKVDGLKSRFRPIRSSPPSRPRRQADKKDYRVGSEADFKHLVETIEKTCAHDRFLASDAASMVLAVKKLLEIEPASGQIWEAYVLDSLETAQIVCDECRISVTKVVKKTGVRIECQKCKKWLALKNSKVTILDPSRSNVEEWEK